MSKKLALVNGIPRMIDEAASPTIYDRNLEVVASSPGTYQILAVTTGTPITLPDSKTYEGAELEVLLNGQRLSPVYDYTYVGAGPTRTQVSLTFDLKVGDYLHFRIDRAP